MQILCKKFFYLISTKNFFYIHLRSFIVIWGYSSLIDAFRMSEERATNENMKLFYTQLLKKYSHLILFLHNKKKRKKIRMELYYFLSPLYSLFILKWRWIDNLNFLFTKNYIDSFMIFWIKFKLKLKKRISIW
jgi:hypothetical protein